MITAVRLRPYSRKGENRMRTYTAVDGQRYVAGSVGSEPSTIYNVQPSQLAEFSEIAQFQVMHFESIEDLEKFVTLEMEKVARAGGSSVRARLAGFPEKVEAKISPVIMKVPDSAPVEVPAYKPVMKPAMEKLTPTKLEEEPKEEEPKEEEPASKPKARKSRPRPRKSSK